MRIALVAVPHTPLDVPPKAHAVLSALLRERFPEHTVDADLPFLEWAKTLGIHTYHAIATHILLGETLFAPYVHPERADAAKAYFVEKLPGLIVGDHLQTLRYDVAYGIEHAGFASESPPILPEIAAETGLAARPTRADLEALYDRLHALAVRFVSDLARRLSVYDLVIFVSGGFIGQAYVPPTFMASVAAASALSRIAPDVRIALCGYAAVANTQEYYELFDKVVTGDPESDILAYVQNLVEARRSPLAVVPLALPVLPTPDYREFKTIVDGFDEFPEWRIPIEGSRGCW